MHEFAQNSARYLGRKNNYKLTKHCETKLITTNHDRREYTGK
jgi:hypothetical protein